MKTEISRRAFVVGSLAAGFALAVMPVSADTITTDSNGLVAGEVKIPVEGGEIPAYRAMPASGGPFPTVLVVHEIFGVHEHIKDICRRLAKLGYFAVAPLLFAREGDVSSINDMQQISEIVERCRTNRLPPISTLPSHGRRARVTLTPRNSASPGSAGAAARCGCMPRTTRRSKREWRGTGRCSRRRRSQAEESDRSGQSDQRTNARSIRRQGHEDHGCADRTDAGRAEGRRQAV